MSHERLSDLAGEVMVQLKNAMVEDDQKRSLTLVSAGLRFTVTVCVQSRNTQNVYVIGKNDVSQEVLIPVDKIDDAIELILGNALLQRLLRHSATDTPHLARQRRHSLWL